MGGPSLSEKSSAVSLFQSGRRSLTCARLRNKKQDSQRLETLVSILVPTTNGTAVTRQSTRPAALAPAAHAPVASADGYALIKPSISPSITALILAFFKAVRHAYQQQRIRAENIGANLAAPFNLLLNALDVRDFLKMLALLDLNQLGTQHAEQFPCSAAGFARSGRLQQYRLPCGISRTAGEVLLMC